MTVQELIEALQELPPDATATIEEGYIEVTSGKQMWSVEGPRRMDR